MTPNNKTKKRPHYTCTPNDSYSSITQESAHATLRSTRTTLIKVHVAGVGMQFYKGFGSNV